MKQVKDMTVEELQYQASKIDWDKVPEYNRINWVHDGIGTVRAKLESVINNEEYKK
jgi:hypothetical protein